MGNLIAAAAALGPGGRQFPAAHAAAAAAAAAASVESGKEENRGADRSRALREDSPPSDWSMGPESPNNGSVTALAGGDATVAGRPRATLAAHRRAQASPGEASMSSPVLSLSGHLIGPEVRCGGGSADMKKRAHDAFVKEVVTLDEYSRRPQVGSVLVLVLGVFLAFSPCRR